MALRSNTMKTAVSVAWSLSKMTGIAFGKIAKYTMIIAHKITKG